VFQKFKWDGDAWKTFFIYIVGVPGLLYYSIAYEHQLVRRMKYGFELDLPGVPYKMNKKSIEEKVEGAQKVEEQAAGWVRGGGKF